MRFAIFGAKSIALGVYRAIQKLYKNYEVSCFLVSSKSGNPEMLAGIPVHELRYFTDKDTCILIATPEDIHEEIIEYLTSQGFYNYICIDSVKESNLMEKYYMTIDKFPSLHAL